MSEPNPNEILPPMSPSARPVPPDERESIPLTQASDQLTVKAIEAARAGQSQEAVRLLDEALALNEDNVEALLWRGGLSPANESLPYLERALALDPTNERVRSGLKWARQRVGLSSRPSTPPAAQPAHAPEAGKAETAAARRSEPMAFPDFVGMARRALAYIVEHPLLALATVILLLGILGTAAAVRAGLSRNVGPTPTPQSQISTHIASAEAAAPAALPSTARAAASQSVATADTVPTPLLVTRAALDQAMAAKDWATASAIMEQMQKREPGNAELADKLYKAYFNYGKELVGQDRLREAIPVFDKALMINATDTKLQDERKYAVLYLQGSDYLANDDPGMAVWPFRQIYDVIPTYKDVKAKVYQSYVLYCQQLEKEGKLTEAYTYYVKASRVDPKGTEAQQSIVRLKDSAPDSVKQSAGKKIDISLGKQQVTVYENDRVLWQFKASTGAGGNPTRVGTFEILSRMPTAYSKALGWTMPYWMGIYQAGGTENGLHGLARLDDGRWLTTAVLGRPATSGCIMMSNEDAATLYNWATIGTTVVIHY